jgi:hypothetical protein
MFLTCVGFIGSTVCFAGIAALILWLTPFPRISVLTFVTFVLFAHGGAITFMVVYGYLFGTPSHELTSRASVIGLLIGTPLCASVTGWTGSSLAAIIRTKIKKR